MPLTLKRGSTLIIDILGSINMNVLQLIETYIPSSTFSPPQWSPTAVASRIRAGAPQVVVPTCELQTRLVLCQPQRQV